MLSAIVSGTLATDPRSGTSKTGTEWANAVVRCPVGQNRETGDQESAFVQVAAFGDEAAKLSRLAKGDAVSASGALKPSTYTAKTGEERHGLSLTVNTIMSAYMIRKKAGANDAAPKPAPGTGRNVTTAYEQWRGQDDQDFNDEVSF